MKARQISMPGGRRHRNRAPAMALNLRQLVSKCCFVGNTRQAAQTAHALADVNHLWPVGNELETPVPPLSHKQFPRWLRIAFTGVARATRGVPSRGGEIWASVSSSCWPPSSAADGVDVLGRRPQRARASMDAKAFDKSRLPSRGGSRAHEGRGRVRGQSFEPLLGDLNLDTNQKAVSSISHPISATGGVVGMHGSLASHGAIFEVAGLATHAGGRAEVACYADI